jgi:lysophospholipase L1-like esterase
VRHAHPQHRYRTRRAIGPLVTVVAVIALMLLGLVGPGSGRDAAGPSVGVPDPVAFAGHQAALTGPDSSSVAGAHASATNVMPGGAPATLTDVGPNRLSVQGTGPVPRASRHHAAVLPGAELAAISHLGRGVKAVFLGDSYTSGWNGAGIGARGWPALVGVDRGWKVVNLAVPGTGFLNPGWTDQTIGSRVAAAIAQKPQVVFVAGGHNDSRWEPATTSTAAIRAIDRLHAALPDAVIVIVAPIWQDGSPPTRCLVLRDALRRKAAAIGAVFIDPLGERWFGSASHRFISADGLHPTNAGHAWLAKRILADLAGI